MKGIGMDTPQYTSTGPNPDPVPVTEENVDQMPVADQIKYWKKRSRASEARLKKHWRHGGKLQAERDRLLKEWERK
jgi:hypothetical protein